MGGFLQGYQGIARNSYFNGIYWAYFFFIATAAINYYVLRRGIRGGIEKLANIGMPLLIVMAIVLVVRVLTLGTPDPSKPDQSVLNGLGFIWNPDLGALRNPKVWLAAAGQIFFTLSVGFGAIQAYASYLRKNDDVALAGIATASTNEFCEVICGGTIAIPIACAFFGVAATQAIAQGGSFNLAFQSMPIVFQHLPLGNIFGFMWFFLLFIAGVTSSVALTLPAVTFFMDELGWTQEEGGERDIDLHVRRVQPRHLLPRPRIHGRARFLGGDVRRRAARAHRDRRLLLGVRQGQGVGGDHERRRDEGAVRSSSSS